MNFYFENNSIVLTEKYLLERGYCCGNGCRHCPYSDKFYLLKTSNDLFFHVQTKDSKMIGVNTNKLPFVLEIDDKIHTIISCEIV